MRTMMKVHLDLKAANQKIADGSLPKKIQSLIDDLKPEASYFYPDEFGRRTFFMVFDMRDASQIAQIAEPLFEELGAQVHFFPVMNQADLAKGLESHFKQLKKAA